MRDLKYAYYPLHLFPRGELEDGSNDPAPHPSMIRCDHLGLCNFCGRRFTPWRGATFDVHACSVDCYEATNACLTVLKPLAALEPCKDFWFPHDDSSDPSKRGH